MALAIKISKTFKSILNTENPYGGRGVAWLAHGTVAA